ncbi:hypothetical protein DH2020_041687 [Rehmannia glutinosa]|uniref:Reverse transcriptase domain-containing protein n=1 Tax=Rehmannia glutinosa TaxID=99300 RepID=A0ABR0UPJ1_REHGL
MNIISWNCRGLGNPRTIQELRDFIRSKNPQLVFLCETKCKSPVIENLKKSLNFHGCAVDARGRSGGLALLGTKTPKSPSVFSLTGSLMPIRNALVTLFASQAFMENQIETMSHFNMFDLGFEGPPFTWSRLLLSPHTQRARLDRAICNQLWYDLFPWTRVNHCPTFFSDHSLLHIQVQSRNPHLLRKNRRRVFRFEAFWVKTKECEEIIKQHWNDSLSPLPAKIENCSIGLLNWSKHQYGDFDKHIDDIKSRQSKDWYKEGDRIRNFSTPLLAKGKPITTSPNSKISRHFSRDTGEGLERIITASLWINFHLEPPFRIDIAAVCCWDYLQRSFILCIASLTEPYTEAEIVKALKQMHPFKSPVPTLASKVIANRLRVTLPSIISESQSAFVPGRLITDNVLLAHEIHHHIRTKPPSNRGLMSIKLDMSKAFDRIEWTFVRRTMTALGRNKKEMFGYIKDKIWQRIQNWSKHHFSKAGKEILIKSVLQAIPSYAMSCFKFPESVISEIQSMIRGFWWDSASNKKKIHWNSWQSITRKKSEGGIGFRNFRAFNLALLAKQAWRLISNPSSLLARVYKAKYHPSHPFLEAQMHHRPSWTWRSIMDSKKVLLAGCLKRIQSGKNTKVWGDRWIPKYPYHLTCAKPNSVSFSMKVSELINESSNCWNSELIRTLFPNQVAASILSIPLNVTPRNDSWYWIHNKNGKFSVKSAYQTIMHTPNLSDDFVDPGGTSSGIRQPVLHFQQPSFALWIRDLIEDSPTSITEFALTICSGIWYSRNKLIFDNQDFLPATIISSAGLILSSFQAANLWPERPSIVLTDLEILRHPPDGTHIFFDGAISTTDNCAGIGVFIRSRTGSFLKGFSKKIQNIINPDEAEQLALREALIIARSEGHSDVSFIGDSAATIALARELASSPLITLYPFRYLHAFMWTEH